MKELPRIASAEPVIHGVLKLTFLDGYEGIVDLRGIMAEGEIFAYIRDPAGFRSVRVESYGHSIYWGEEGNEEVDFGSDSLRQRAIRQAEILRLAS